MDVSEWLKQRTDSIWAAMRYCVGEGIDRIDKKWFEGAIKQTVEEYFDKVARTYDDDGGGTNFKTDTGCWLVWNPLDRQPRYKHATRESAMTEARRLAEIKRGTRFYVLEVTGFVVAEDVHVENFGSCDIPF